MRGSKDAERKRTQRKETVDTKEGNMVVIEDIRGKVGGEAHQRIGKGV
jgi:hypothetical protein